MALPSSMGALPNIMIKQLRHNGTWNLPFHHSLNQDILQNVLDTRFGREDTSVCRISKDGKPTAKDFYNWMMGTSAPLEWGKLIWNSFILPSRSFLCWRVLHNRIPVEVMFKTQGVKIASQCSLCRTEEESLPHLFYECSFAVSLWKFLSSLFHLHYKILHPWDLFLDTKNLGLSSQIWTLWQVGFFECLWIIWHVRNQIRHEEKHVTVAGACKLLRLAILSAGKLKKGTMHNTIKDLLTLRTLGIEGIPRPPRIAIPVIWSPPPHGVVKINVDGAVSGGKAAIGGVFRLNNGSVLAAFHADIPLCTPFEAEIQALMVAFRHAAHLGLQRIWFETDSLILFQKLSSLNPEVPWSVRRDWEALLLDIVNISFSISHIFREGNRVADFLANLGLLHSGLQWLSTPPRGMLDLLTADAISLRSFRIR